MTVWADWSWWTYFIVNGEVVSHGLIVEYDLAQRRVTYLRHSERSRTGTNPHPLGTAEHSAWLYDTVESQYEHLWVDPERNSVLRRDDYDLLMSGRKPPSFVELVDVDPEAYFAGAASVVATYLPDELLALTHPGGSK
jgi:hypothetical protein